jgi:hypothetical protein
LLAAGDPGQHLRSRRVAARFYCRLCQRYLTDGDQAAAHADEYHTEVTFEEAKAAVVPVENVSDTAPVYNSLSERPS